MLNRLFTFQVFMDGKIWEIFFGADEQNAVHSKLTGMLMIYVLNEKIRTKVKFSGTLILV